MRDKFIVENKSKSLYTAPMSITENKTLLGILFALGGFSSFAFGDVMIKYLGDYYTPYTIAFFTTLFCSIILACVTPKFGGFRKTFGSKKIKLHIVRGLFLAGEFTLLIYGFSQLPMTTTYALIFATPFIASLLAIPLLGERVSPRQWALILLGFAGVLVILRPGFIPLSLPVMGVTLGAVFFAVTNVMVRMIGEKNETIMSFALVPEMVICAVTFVLFLFQPEWPAPMHLLLLVFTGAFSAVALVLIPLAFLKAPAAVISPFHYVQMLWGIIFGYVFFGDIMDVWTSTGAFIIIVSGILLIRREKGKVPDYGTL